MALRLEAPASTHRRSPYRHTAWPLPARGTSLSEPGSLALASVAYPEPISPQRVKFSPAAAFFTNSGDSAKVGPISSPYAFSRSTTWPKPTVSA